MEYSVNDITVAGHGRDTLRFSPYIYTIPTKTVGRRRGLCLYDVMLYVKRDGILREYIPLRVDSAARSSPTAASSASMHR